MRGWSIWRQTAFAAAVIAATPALALDDARVERQAGTLAISWASRNPVDVFVSDRPDASLKDAKRVAKADGDGRFDFADRTDVRRYFLLRDTRTGKTVRVAERVLPLAQGSNFRDLGGYAAAGGRHVRWGLIYRSGATPVLTDADVAQVKALGIRDLVDLRSKEERSLAPTRLTGIRTSAVDYSMAALMPSAAPGTPIRNGATLYHGLPALLAPQIKIVFAKLLGHEGPVAYNCSAGQDRTGFTTAIVLSALGVPRETIVKDYLLSTQYRHPENELPPIDAATAASNPVAGFFAGYQKSPGYKTPQPLVEADGTPFLSGAFAEIDDKWGSTDGYLTRAIGLTRADIARLRKLYLE